MSECFNGNGKKEDSIIYSFDDGTKKFKLSTDTSTYCYIKFAKKNSSIGKIMQNSNGQLETDVNMQLRGDTLRRYQGDAETVKNNYICVGTTEKGECTKNQDKYMYRIMGIVTEDNPEYNEEEGQLKVIKKAPLSGTYQWNNLTGTEYTWDVSDLNYGINGTYI